MPHARAVHSFARGGKIAATAHIAFDLSTCGFDPRQIFVVSRHVTQDPTLVRLCSGVEEETPAGEMCLSRLRNRGAANRTGARHAEVTGTPTGEQAAPEPEADQADPAGNSAVASPVAPPPIVSPA
jgi:hypothetical protein